MNRAVPVFVMFAAGIALAGCGSTPPVAESTATTTVASSTPTPTVTVPTEAQLKSALLTEAEIGAPFKADTPAETPSDSGATTGCESLAGTVNGTSATPGEASATADFTTSEFPSASVSQTLVAEPEASFERSLKENTDALASCKHFTISYKDGTTLSFDLTPVNFAEGATASRLDGAYQGVPLNGYLVIQRISRNVAMLFAFFQGVSESSQLAYHIYTLAADKAIRAFPS